MSDRQEEVDSNYEYFLQELPKLMESQRGRYALIRHRQITGLYDTAIDAQTAASQLYTDGLYSIQQVTNVAADLGFYSHAVHMGAA
jgi:hypothetical protein